MKRWIVAFAVLFVLLASARGVRAVGVSLPDLTDRVATSDGNVSYQGIQNIQEHNGKELITTVRRVWYDRGRIRVEFTDPRTGIDVVMADNGVTSGQAVPALELYLLAPSRLRAELGRRERAIRALLLAPETRLRGEEQLLGRTCWVIESQGRAAGTVIWVDQQTGLPLATERYSSSSGRLLYRLAFTRVEFVTGLPGETFDINCGAGSRVYRNPSAFEREYRLSALARDAGMPVFSPSAIPAAARPVQAEVMRFKTNRVLHVQFRFKDKVLSLFQVTDADNSAEVQRRLKSRLRKLLASRGANVVEWYSRGRRFIMVANVARADLLSIAKSPLEEYMWK